MQPDNFGKQSAVVTKDFAAGTTQSGNACTLDVDGDQKYDALTDGLLITRYLFGFRGEALTTGAVGVGATHRDASTIGDYINALMPTARQ